MRTGSAQALMGYTVGLLGKKKCNPIHKHMYLSNLVSSTPGLLYVIQYSKQYSDEYCSILSAHYATTAISATLIHLTGTNLGSHSRNPQLWFLTYCFAFG